MTRSRSWRRHGPALAAVGLLGVFFLAERRLRVGSSARDLSAGEDDRGSTAVIGATFGSAILTPPLASWLVRARLPSTFRWAGVLAMAGGIGLRIWSAKILGAGYTRTLRVRAEQRVIDAGPYRVIRHPGYAGDIVMWAGWGLAWGTWAGWALASAPSVAAYIYRIGVEEDLLARKLGPAYRSYQARTWRLVPGIW